MDISNLPFFLLTSRAWDSGVGAALKKKAQKCTKKPRGKCTCGQEKRLQLCLHWWKKWASPKIVSLIKEGITPQWVNPPHLSVQARQGSNLEQAKTILAEYETCGAVKRVKPEGTLHFLPWFLISKPEEGGGTKWRFISDCREINNLFQVEKFKLDHSQQIFTALQKGHWAAKIDLKDAYFHLAVHPSLRPYLRHQVGQETYEYQAGPFGLNVMPQLFQGVMKTFQKKWRAAGVQVYIYLDDILLLAPTEKVLQKHLQLAVHDLVDSGFKINVKKSVLTPSQVITHLGFQLNFLEGKLQLHPHKIKTVRKELGKFVIKDFMSKKQMASILGQIRANLLALPFLRAFTSQLVLFLQRTGADPWEKKFPISEDIKSQLREVGTILKSWSGRPFPHEAKKLLHSDSSDLSWGGLDVNSGKMVQEYRREKSALNQFVPLGKFTRALGQAYMC